MEITNSQETSAVNEDVSFHGTYAAILGNIADGILGIDCEGKIIYMNSTAEELTGWRMESIGNKRISEVFRLVHAQSGQSLPDVFGQVLETGVRTGLMNHTMLVSRDGTRRYLSANISPVRDESGSIIGAVGVFRDITRFKTIEEELRREKDRYKRSEMRLKESENKFKTIFHNVTDAIFVLVLKDICPGCRKNRIIEANETASRLFGYSRDEFLHADPGEMIFDLEKHGSKLRDAVRNGVEAKIETTLVKKDGDSVIAELSVNVMMLHGKQVFIAIVRDVTEQRKAQKEIQKAIEATKAAYRAKSQFLANMSHEIRTPLNGIIGMIDLCLLTPLTAEQKEDMTIAKSCATTLLSIINNILDFSKLEAGKMVLEHIPFNPRELADRLEKVHLYRAADKGLSLEVSYDQRIPEALRGDPKRLEQVLNNLLSNAVKFTEAGAVSMRALLVRKDRSSVRIRFEVADTGIGISEEDRDKLFQSFTQVDGSHTRKYGGTGLGLVISKQLVESMGGYLDVESEKGVGSTFYFELGFDIEKAPDIPGSAGDAAEDLKKARKKAHILLVEDDTVNQMVVSQMLNMLGYSCEIAENGLVALDFISRKQYDLCLMDIQMPEMDGIRAVQEIRRREAGGAHLPVIALTAYALPGDRDRFIGAGMDDYLSKPVGINDLGEKLQLFLESCGTAGDRSAEPGDGSPEKHGRTTPLMESGEGCMNNLRMAIERRDAASVEKYAHDLQILASDAGEEFLKMEALRMVLLARKGRLEELPDACRRLTGQWEAYLGKLGGR